LSTEVEHRNNDNDNNDDNDKEKDRIEWRRSKVQELSSKGNSQREISQVLQVGLAKYSNSESTFHLLGYKK
jgi:hypothetical protein